MAGISSGMLGSAARREGDSMTDEADPEYRMFVVTNEWIEGHRSDRGGWTRTQIEALGEGWPPTHGWRRRAVGKEISRNARVEFEQALRSRQARSAASLELFS
jgi:hypothetical protein